MTFVVNPESSNIRPLPSCCTCMNYESLFQVPVNLYIFSFRIGVSNSFSSSVEISKQKNKSDFNIRGMADLQESDSRLASAAEMVLALDLNFERAKAGDVGKCYNTNICNRPFPSFPRPLYQNKVKCSAFDAEMIFHSHANKTHFHKKACALGLTLKVRVLETRNWPIQISKFMITHY